MVITLTGELMNIGIIGTGLMGSSLARCLARRGVSLGYYNRTIGKAEKLAMELGGFVYTSPTELLEHSDAVITFIDTDESLIEVSSSINLTQTHGIEKKVFINASTITPMASIIVKNLLKNSNVEYVEAPVYGSTDEAAECRLLSMVACKPDAFNIYENVIKLYSYKTIYVGEVPRALVIKLALNNIGLSIPAILAESLMLLESWSVEIDIFQTIISEIWFGRLIERYWSRILEEKPARFKTRLAAKDYAYMSKSLKVKGLPAILSDAFTSLYSLASLGEYSEKDYPQVAKFFMEMGRRSRLKQTGVGSF